MRRYGLISCVILSGCSIYPLPDDVMEYSSRDIALQTRCEARYSVQKEIEATAKAQKNQIVYGTLTGYQFEQTYASDPARYRELDWKKFHSPLREVWDFYKDTSVSYDFTLDGTEQNNMSFDVGIIGQFAKRTDTIGVGAGNERTREVKRAYRIFDSFDSLAILMPESLCHNFTLVDLASKLPDKSFTKNPNYWYPSTGMLKIRTLIHDFLLQNQTNNLGGLAKDWSTASMTDTITFTTKTTGKLNPSTELTPDGHGWGLASLTFGNNASRQDVHTIIINVSLPVDKTGLAQFDQYGRLTLRQARLLQAGANLDKARENNFQDDFRNLAKIVARPD